MFHVVSVILSYPIALGNMAVGSGAGYRYPLGPLLPVENLQKPTVAFFNHAKPGHYATRVALCWPSESGSVMRFCSVHHTL
jgi:hypothetical protein